MVRVLQPSAEDSEQCAMSVGDKVHVNLLRPFEGVITALVWESTRNPGDSVYAVAELGTTTIHNVNARNLEVSA